MGLAMGGRSWRGRALCAFAGVHTLVACVEFAPVWRELWAAGVVDSVGRDPLRGAVAWFFLFGVLLALLGLAVDCRWRGGCGVERGLACLVSGVMVRRRDINGGKSVLSFA